MRRPNIDLAFLLALGVAFSAASSVWAQETVDAFKKEQKPANSEVKPKTDDKAAKPKDPKPKDPKPSASKPKDPESTPQSVSPERRAELMEFVKAHHPELQPLLNQLQSKRKKRFQTVLVKLDEEVKRLQWLEKKYPTRHKRALNQWVLTSKVQLLKAQLSLTKSEKEEAAILKKIKVLFGKQHDLQSENTKVDIESAKRKQERLVKVLKTHQANRDKDIARKLAEITNASKHKKKSPEKKKSSEKENPAKDEAQKKKPSAEKAKPAQKANSAKDSKPTQKAKPANNNKPKQEKTKAP